MGGSLAYLRIYANASFATEDGETILQGLIGQRYTLFKEVICTVDGATLNIPQFTLPSTEGSPTNRRATYTAILFTSQGARVRPNFMTNFAVPDSLETQTWTTLALHQNARNPSPSEGVIDIGQVEYMIQEAIDGLQIQQAGTASLVAGEASVGSSVVESDSVIITTGQAETVSGQVRAVNIVEGESFDLLSTNLADEGNVGWILLEPSS